MVKKKQLTIFEGELWTVYISGSNTAWCQVRHVECYCYLKYKSGWNMFKIILYEVLGQPLHMSKCGWVIVNRFGKRLHNFKIWKGYRPNVSNRWIWHAKHIVRRKNCTCCNVPMCNWTCAILVTSADIIFSLINTQVNIELHLHRRLYHSLCNSIVYLFALFTATSHALSPSSTN